MEEKPSIWVTHRKNIMGQRPIMGILGENQEKYQSQKYKKLDEFPRVALGIQWPISS